MFHLNKLLPRSKKSPRTLIRIHPDLLHAIERIADQQQLPFSQVVNDLLHNAVLEYQTASASLTCWQQLTRREQDVIALIAQGMTNKEIGDQLIISTHTVKAHVRSILGKFEVHSKEALRDKIAGIDFSDWLHKLGLIPEDTPISAVIDPLD
ncbi:MAG: helix-turn-helix transcriptional regulator [Chloroflexi bacterium]|nr:helix-turn-helix transcriptional regulator [Chloroflexota bacterium]